jgi:Type I restriction enzyme R protein N terminus (HSDR_N)
MAAVPSKVATRIAAGVKQFQPIIASAKSRDVNESDTVVIVTDMLSAIFGYDKYAEVTSEHTIRSTFCDLAIRLDGNKISFLIEVKAVGMELKEPHVKQAVDYAANQGVDWVVLTNGLVWRAYKISFSKPIEAELVLEFNICDLNPKTEQHTDLVYLLSKEGWLKSQLGEYHSQRQALSRFSLAALVLSQTVLDVMRRELRRMSPGIRIETEQIEAALRSDVLKREVLEGDKADAARKLVSKAAHRVLRAKSENPADGCDPAPKAPSDDKSQPG